MRINITRLKQVRGIHVQLTANDVGEEVLEIYNEKAGPSVFIPVKNILVEHGLRNAQAASMAEQLSTDVHDQQMLELINQTAGEEA